MPKASGSKRPKKSGRSRKAVQEKLEIPKKLEQTPEEITIWEDEGGSSLPIDDEDTPKPLKEVLSAEITHNQRVITDQQLFRKKQWDSLDDHSRAKMQMTEEEFLVADDVTGFGPNSYFTPREER